MSDAVIREYRGGDIPEMSALWQAVFGDSEGLVNSFLQLLPDMGTAAVAEVNGKIAGAAYAVTGMELVSASGKVQIYLRRRGRTGVSRQRYRPRAHGAQRGACARSRRGDHLHAPGRGVSVRVV